MAKYRQQDQKGHFDHPAYTASGSPMIGNQEKSKLFEPN